jgi:hypothetical protein
MAKREKQEKDQWDRLLDQIDFHGLTQEEVVSQSGVILQVPVPDMGDFLQAEPRKNVV